MPTLELNSQQLQRSIRGAQACLICVGSELLRGKVNTHTSTLSRRLASIGVEITEEITLADDLPRLIAAVEQVLLRCHLIFITGGLGPTFDDVTREAVAAATGRSLELSKALLEEISGKFRRAGYARMPPANARQAFLVKGGEPLANTVGTAPGQWLDIDGRSIILLPGPPSELVPMLEKAVLPRLRRRVAQKARAEAHLHFVGVPESLVDDKVRPIIRRAEKSYGADVQFTILAHLGLVDFDIFLAASSRRVAESGVRKIASQVRHRMGSRFYGMDDDYPLEKVIADGMRRLGSTLGVAESCTGGMLSSKLTSIPGSSDYFLGGIVSYNNRVKSGSLGVNKDLLERYGAVSAQTAEAMARGVRNKFGADVGLSITGIAGPGGATLQKPVGLVWLGLATAKGTHSFEYRFRGSRESVRERAVIAALERLRGLARS